jgi:hypothetical protein
MMVLDIVSWHGLLPTEVQVGEVKCKYAKTSQGELHRAEGVGHLQISIPLPVHCIRSKNKNS